MATKDFSAKQIRVSQLLASGGIAGTTAGLAIYSASNASNLEGGFSDANTFSGFGSDVFFFVSGSANQRTNVSLFGGDVVVSGTLYPGGNSDQFISADGTEIIIDGNDHVDIRIDTSFGVYSGAGGTVNPIFAVYSSNGTVVNTNGLLYQDFRVESDNKEGSILLDSQTEQLALLVNATTAATAYAGAAIPSDISLYVSGAIGGKGTEATSVFGGDVVISGSLHGGSPLQIGEYQPDVGTDVVLYVSGTTPSGGGGKGTSNGTTVLNSDLVVSGTYRGGYDPAAGSESFQAVSDNYLFMSSDADFGSPQIQATDSNFFFTGSIGSRGGGTLGTAVFGGDVVTSGSLFVMTGSNQGIILESPNGTQFYLTVDDSGNLSTSQVP